MSSSETTSLVILDLDRTLVFRDGFTELYIQSVSELGISPDVARSHWDSNHGTPLHQQLKDLGVAPDQADAFAKQAFKKAESLPVVALPGARDLLERLQGAGVKTAVSSGSGQRLVEAALQESELNTFIDLALGSAPGNAKGSEHTETILQAFNVRVENIAAVGDGRKDMEIARDAGFPLRIGVVFPLNGPRSAEQLRAGGATHIVDGLAEVAPVLL